MFDISGAQLQKALDYPALIEALQLAFQEDITVPLRHHHDYENPAEGVPSTLLLMPAWKAGEYLGVKIITVSPNNGRYGLPAIHGSYLLFDAHKGMPLAHIDARTLTALRTAAASALAASFLSRKNSQTLLMIGTGVLAPHLIRAHAAVRPVRQVLVWGRDRQKAAAVATLLRSEPFDIRPADTLEGALKEADIISCATLSKEPLVQGEWLRPGQHLDLVGSYKPDMREADDEAIRRAVVFVDTLEGATKESGDIVIPLENGTLRTTDIKSDLFGLCREEHPGRKSEHEITFFKSVGHALEDLAAARLAFRHVGG